MVLIDTARSLKKDIISLGTMENLSTGDQVMRDSWGSVQLYLAGNLSGLERDQVSEIFF